MFQHLEADEEAEENPFEDSANYGLSRLQQQTQLDTTSSSPTPTPPPQQHQSEAADPTPCYTGIIYRNTHKHMTKPKDLKKRNSQNSLLHSSSSQVHHDKSTVGCESSTNGGAGHGKPSRSKSVEELRLRFWDWVGLRKNRPS